VHAGTGKGLGALHVAALHGQAAILAALLQAGGDVEAGGDGTPPPLHYAAWSGSEECTALLLGAGAVPRCSANACGNSPMHWAAARGHLAVLKCLQAWPSLLQSAAADGTTPLMRAAAAGHSAVVQHLLAQGVSLVMRDSMGRRACDMAAELDLRAELTPLPPQFHPDELRPAIGRWLVLPPAQSTSVLPMAYSTAIAAIRTLLRCAAEGGAEGSTPGCVFAAKPAANGEQAAADSAGGFGSVSLQCLGSSKLPCAVKTLHCSTHSPADALAAQRELAYEIRVQHSVSSALRLARVLGVTSSGSASASVSEFIPGVTLDWVCNLPPGSVPLHVVRQLACSLTEAVHELHASEVAHRDVHGGNVMVHVGAAGQWQCTLVDFGLSFQWSMRVDGYAAQALQSMHQGLLPPFGAGAPSADTLVWQRGMDWFGAACLVTRLLSPSLVPRRTSWQPEQGSFGNAMMPLWRQWASTLGDVGSRRPSCGAAGVQHLVLQLLAVCGVDTSSQEANATVSAVQPPLAPTVETPGEEAHEIVCSATHDDASHQDDYRYATSPAAVCLEPQPAREEKSPYKPVYAISIEPVALQGAPRCPAANTDCDAPGVMQWEKSVTSLPASAHAIAAVMEAVLHLSTV
jgi:hypothetical protein